MRANVPWLFNKKHYATCGINSNDSWKPVTGGVYNKRDMLNKRNNTLTQGTQTFTMMKTGTVGLFIALTVVRYFFLFHCFIVNESSVCHVHSFNIRS